MTVMAREDRKWFDKQVDDCRRFESGPTTPEPSN
jgi:hypothetical protein